MAWQRTTFARWIAAYGVPRLAVDLAAQGIPYTDAAIYTWLAGTSSPRPETACALVVLSRNVLTLDTIYGTDFARRFTMAIDMAGVLHRARHRKRLAAAAR